jgi:hypothetical protein
MAKKTKKPNQKMQAWIEARVPNFAGFILSSRAMWTWA